MYLSVLIHFVMSLIAFGLAKRFIGVVGRLKSRHFVQSQALHSQSPLKEATTLFSEWAMDGRDKKMAEGHELAVTEMLREAEHYLPSKPFSFLDLGTGNGWVARKMSGHPRCASSLGVDGAHQMVTNAIKMEETEQTGASFIQSNLNDFQPKQAVDVIFSMEVLYYLNEDEVKQLFKNVSKWLAPDGLFVWGIDHFEENKGCHDWSSINGVHMLLWTESQWKEAMDEAGLSIVKCWRAANRPEMLDMPGASECYEGSAGTLAFIVKNKT